MGKRTREGGGGGHRDKVPLSQSTVQILSNITCWASGVALETAIVHALAYPNCSLSLMVSLTVPMMHPWVTEEQEGSGDWLRTSDIHSPPSGSLS